MVPTSEKKVYMHKITTNTPSAPLRISIFDLNDLKKVPIKRKRVKNLKMHLFKIFPVKYLIVFIKVKYTSPGFQKGITLVRGISFHPYWPMVQCA